VPTFLQDYLSFTKDWESPHSFWLWSGLSIISGVMRDHVHCRYGPNTIYPNMYVLLLAESAVHRKGAPVVEASRLLNRVNNTRILEGRSSVQGLIDGIKNNETNDKGKLQKGGSAICLLPEMAAGLVQDVSAIQILTDIYDFKEKYTTRLRGIGEFRIDKLVFSILAGSNIDMLNELFTTSAVYGGFLGRTFVIKPDEKRPANSLLKNLTREQEATISKLEEDKRESLVNQLRNIAELKGTTVISKRAVALYEAWYQNFREKSFNTKDNLGIGKTGVTGRIHTGIIKVAIVMAANQLSLEITEDIMSEAISDCLMLLENYREFIGKSPGATQQSTVAQAILSDLCNRENAGILRRRKFIFDHLDLIEGQNLDVAALSLESAGILTIDTTGGETVYHLTKEAREKMLEDTFNDLKDPKDRRT